jgi:hypothetical protein
MNINFTSNYLNSLPQFLSKPRNIKCSNHPENLANSYCCDCGVFICKQIGCGNIHLYHQVENLDDLLFYQILPKLNELIDINSKVFFQSNINNNGLTLSTNFLFSINLYKNNLKQFIIEEKEKIFLKYKEVFNILQKVYHEYLNQFDIFMDNINQKLDLLIKNITSSYQLLDNNIEKKLNNLNQDISNMINISNNKIESFVKLIGKKEYIDNMNKILKNIQSENNNKKNYVTLNQEFNNQIEEIKNYAKQSFSSIDKKGETFLNNLLNNFKVDYENLIKFNNDLKERFNMSNNKFISPKKLSKIANSILNLDNDLDLFIRDLFNKINEERKLNGNNKELNWDNDLSNSAEDFLNQKNGKFNEYDLNSYSNEIKNILNQSYYNEVDYLNKINTIPYINQDKDIEKIIQVLNNYYKYIFSNDFNIIGINAEFSKVDKSKINLIINLGYIKYLD